MAILVTCTCGKQFTVKDELAGKRGKCAACGLVVTVPPSVRSVDQKKIPPTPLRACPTCQEALKPNAVICLNCGLDLRTGKQLPHAKSETAKDLSKASAKAATTSARLPIALIAAGACLAAVICLVGIGAGVIMLPGGATSKLPDKSEALKKEADLSFEEAFRAGQIAWQGVKNATLTTRTAGQQKIETFEFVTKFKYDSNGKRSTDTTGYKTYTWPDREATFGPGAVIRLTQNSKVREGALRLGDKWTWTGQQWTAKPKKSQPPGNAPPIPAAEWAAQMAKRLESRRFKNVDVLKRAAKMPKGTAKVWGDALDQVTEQKVQALALFQFITLFGPIWKGEEFLPAESQRYVGRIKQLPKDAVSKWRDGFRAATGAQTEELPVVLALIQVDYLYDAERFRTARAAQLLPRLRSLSPKLLQPWADALGCKALEAAGELIDTDWLFDNDRLKASAAEEALRTLRAAGIKPTESQPPGNALPAVKTLGDTPSVQPVLEGGFRVTGSATFRVINRRVNISDVTYQQARLQLQLANSTDYPIQLGTRMLLIDTNADGSNFDGVLVGLRLPRDADSKGELWHTKGAYLLGTTESRYAGGGQFTTGGSIQALLSLNSHEVTDDSKEDKLPEQVGARSQTPLVITLNRGSWLPDNARGAVRCALPEIGVVTQQGVDRYRLIVTFKKTGADQAPWIVGRHDWMRVDKTKLARVLDSSTDMATRVLAANWWMELDPAGARPALVRLGQTQTEGTLLQVCLSLLAQKKDDGLCTHAAKLLKAPGTPPGICMSAAAYLAQLGQDPDLAPLLSLARGSNDKSARNIILFFGNLNTPGAIRGREALLQDPNLNARHQQIRANLERAKKRGSGP